MNKIFYSYFNEDNIDNIISGLTNETEYICTIPYVTDLSELLITRVIEEFLEKINRRDTQQSISIIVNQLVHNVDRINKTHSFFTENSLDITDKKDFIKGITALSDGSYYKSFNKKGYYIKIKVKVTDRELYLCLENNTEFSQLEKYSLNKLLDKCEALTNIDQLFYDTPDLIEDFNFGMMIAVLLLKQHSINRDAIVMTSSESVTITELTIPFLQLSEKLIHTITDEIATEILSLPQFPESISSLQKEIMDPEWDYERITDNILSDPALTAEILRHVNSPIYNNGTKTDKISTAVKKIGINGLKAILYDYGSMQILESRYNINKIKRYKEHLFQVALISSYLANYMKFNDFAEDIYVAALMHDIGKIVVQAISSDVSKKLTKICLDRNISLDIIDKLSDGYNHSVVGAKLSEKWNFPEKYTNAIQYHHLPHQCPDEYKIVTYCVYLGNEITQIIDKKSKFSNINSSVLKFFKLNNLEEFTTFLNNLKKEGLLL